MYTIEQCLKIVVQIVAGTTMAATVSAGALAQEAGPVVGPASNDRAAVIDSSTPPPLSTFAAHGSSTNVSFSSGSTCGTALQCSSGVNCGCQIASGNATSATLGKLQYNIQTIGDANSALWNGRIVSEALPSDCNGAQGVLTLTFGTNSVNMDTAGLICFTLHGQIVYTGTYTVIGGGGKYSASYGGGSVSWAYTSTAPGGINNTLYLTGTLAK